MEDKINEPNIEADPIIPDTFLGRDLPTKALIRNPIRGNKMIKYRLSISTYPGFLFKV
jgi:hypothetical protein